MAFTRLGGISIKTAFTFNLQGSQTYNDGDRLYVYLDSSDNSVKVYLNPTDLNDPTTGTLQSDGNSLTKFMVDQGIASVKSLRYSVCDGNNLIRYYRNGEQFWNTDFPYFPPETDLNSPSCVGVVCDLEGVNSSFVAPTTTTSSDGSITVTVATSDSDIPQFLLKDFEYGNGLSGGQSVVLDGDGKYRTSYTFTGLSQGTYTVHSKDALGCSYVFDTFILNATKGGDNYALRYRAEFTDNGNTTVSPTSFDNYRIDIKEKGYTDASGEISYMSGDPLVITTGSGGTKYSPIKGSRIDFKIKSMTNNQYTSVFFGGQDRIVSDGKIVIEVYQNDILIKKGYFLSEGYSEPYMDAPYDISLRFVDGLADLSSRLYQDISGKDSSFNIILSCLKEINLPDMKLRVINGTYPSDDYDSSGNLTADASACSFMSAFVDKQSYEGLTFKDTLEGVLQSMPEPMCIRSDGEYYVIQPEVLDASAYNYIDYDLNGVYDASGTFNPYKDEGKVRSGSDTSFNGTLNRDNVYKKIKVVEDRIVRDSVFNPFTEDFITGDAVGEDIVGTGFLGYTTDFNGDGGSFFVKKVDISTLRKETKLIQKVTETQTIAARKMLTANGYDSYSVDSDSREIVNTFYRKSDIGSNYRRSVSDDYFLSFSILDGQGGNAFLTSSSSIECSIEDDFEFSFDYFIDISDSQIKAPLAPEFAAQSKPPYLKLRYELLITDSSNNKYYINGNDWQKNPTSDGNAINIVNEIFIDDYDGIKNFTVSGKMPITDNNCTVSFKIYDLDVYYVDDDRTVSVVFSELDSEYLPVGYRYIIDLGSLGFGYFELLPNGAQATNAYEFTALNRTDVKWYLVQTNQLTDLSTNPNCEFAVSNINFSTLPSGTPFSDTFKEENSISSDNIYDFEYPVFHFNVRGNQTNEKGMILNYWRDASGSPLSGWGADDEFSQSIILSELTGQYRNPAQKININARYFSQINATNTLRITYDNNRLFKFNSFSWMPKSRMITGEIVEIGIAGQEISIGEYSSAFSSAFSI